MEQDIYVILPKLLQSKWMSKGPNPEPLAWKLISSVYGLRTASAGGTGTLCNHLQRRDEDPRRRCRLPPLRSRHDSSLFSLDKGPSHTTMISRSFARSCLAPSLLLPKDISDYVNRLLGMSFVFLIFVDDSRACTCTPLLNAVFMSRCATAFTVTEARADLHSPDSPPEEHLKILISYTRVNGKLQSTWGQDLALRKFLFTQGRQPQGHRQPRLATDWHDFPKGKTRSVEPAVV